MFNIGDLVIYSTHGVCKIIDICEKTIGGVTREYYELHPVENEQQLTISAPVHDKRISIMEIMDKNQADDVLNSFKNPMMEDVSTHPNTYTKLVDSGERLEIANIVNSLMRKKMELEQDDKKLNKRELDLLVMAQDALFKELSISLDTSLKQINDRIVGLIKQENVS